MKSAESVLASEQGGDMAESKLGGWWRLWVLLTVVLGAIVFAASFNPNPAKLEWVESVPADAKILGALGRIHYWVQ